MGALLCLPFLARMSNAAVALTGDPGVAVALGHLGFNLGIALIFLPTLHGVEPFLRRRLTGE